MNAMHSGTKSETFFEGLLLNVQFILTYKAVIFILTKSGLNEQHQKQISIICQNKKLVARKLAIKPILKEEVNESKQTISLYL